MDVGFKHYDMFYREVKELFHYSDEEILDWYPSGKLEITIEMKNGECFVYDATRRDVRRIFNYKAEETTEDRFRTFFSLSLQRCMRVALMDQEMLARAAGVSRNTISKYINCKATPSAYIVFRLAAALRCSPNELLLR